MGTLLVQQSFKHGPATLDPITGKGKEGGIHSRGRAEPLEPAFRLFDGLQGGREREKEGEGGREGGRDVESQSQCGLYIYRYVYAEVRRERARVSD